MAVLLFLYLFIAFRSSWLCAGGGDGVGVGDGVLLLLGAIAPIYFHPQKQIHTVDGKNQYEIVSRKWG